MSEKKIRLGKKVAKNIANKDKGAGGGFLKLPGDTKIFKEKPDSKVLLDIMPYEVTDTNHMDKDEDSYPGKGDIWWRRPLKVHYGVGVNNQKIICPTTFGKPCPICEYMRQEELEKDEYTALRPRNRIIYAVIPIDNKDHDEEVHIWEISYKNFQERLELEMEDDPETLGEFPNLEGGYTLRVKFTKQTMGKTTYAEASKIDFEEREEDYDESILEDVPNLDDIIVVNSYEEIYQTFYGEAMNEDETAEAEDEEEKPKKKVSRKKKTTSTSKEKNDETTEDEEKPKTSSRKRKTTTSKSTAKSTKKEGVKKKDESKEEEDETCPNGLDFGKDWDSDDVCEDCDKWEACNDKHKEKYK